MGAEAREIVLHAGDRCAHQFDPLFADPHRYGVADVFALSNHVEGSALVSVAPMQAPEAPIQARQS